MSGASDSQTEAIGLALYGAGVALLLLSLFLAIAVVGVALTG